MDHDTHKRSGKTFIGIDIGTTTIKGGVLDVDELCIRNVLSVPFPAAVAGLESLCFEVPTEAIVSAVLAMIKNLLSHTLECRGIVMCGQMHGLILLNNDNEPLTNVITWRDERALLPVNDDSRPAFEVLSEKVSESDRLRLGNNLAPNRPVSVLFTQSELAKRMKANPIPLEATAVSLPDFVIARICQQEPCTDLTNAVATGAFDYSKFDWHYELLSSLGLGRLKWPRIGSFGEIVGYCSINGQRLPCFLPVGDHQCSLLGSLLSAGELSLNVSTGSQVSMISRGLILSKEFQTIPYFDCAFLKTLVHAPAGRALNALIGLLTELAIKTGYEIRDPWLYIEQAVGLVDDTEMLVDLTFFPSSGDQAGSIKNIRENTLTVGHLFHAAFKCMAQNHYECALRIDPAQDWKMLVLSGGLITKSAALKGFVQRLFRTEMRMAPNQTDCALTGLLIMASVFHGRFGSAAAAASAVRVENV